MNMHSVKLENAKIVITNSKVKHSLVDSAYNDRRTRMRRQHLKELQTVVDIKGLGDLKRRRVRNNIKMPSRDPVRQKTSTSCRIRKPENYPGCSMH